MRKLLFALLIEVAPAGDPPPPDRLRLTGTRCHDSAEGRVFELQSATIRDRPHWQTPITEGATPLHITWTPATRNDLGQTMTGGWRIDVSTDLAELNGGDGPRVARANFDSPIPPFGTRHPDECTDKYYCMESGGGWREKCDGEYGLSPIVLEQHFSADACEECAAGCPLNEGSGLICSCCPRHNETVAFVAEAPTACDKPCPDESVLVSPPCVYPPICQGQSDVEKFCLGSLLFLLGALLSQMIVKRSVKDVPWDPARGEESLGSGPAGIFRRFELSRAVRRLQLRRSSHVRTPAGQRTTRSNGSLSGRLLANETHPVQQGTDPVRHSGWLTEAECDRRLFVELRGTQLSLWSAEADSNREKLGQAELIGSVVSEFPKWSKVEEGGGFCGGVGAKARGFLLSCMDGNAAKSRQNGAQRFAYGFTVELSQPDSTGVSLYTFCANRPVRAWSEACLQAAGAGSTDSSAMRGFVYLVCCDDVDHVSLSTLQHASPVLVEMDGRRLLYSDDSGDRTLQLEDYTVELVISFRAPLSTQVIGCVLHMMQALLEPITVLILAMLYVGDKGELALNWYVCIAVYSLGALAGLPWAWTVLSRAETIETFALVPRPLKTGVDWSSECVIIRTASKRERDTWMAAVSTASTAGIQGFSLAFLKRFVQQNQKFMSQPGREYVKKAFSTGRKQTGKVAVWDASLVEVEMDVTATTTNTTYELIKPMTEQMQDTYVRVAEAASDEIADADVTELYGELFAEFDQQRQGWLSQTEWIAFLEAVGAPKGSGDISYEERDRQVKFYDLEEAAEMLDIKLNDKRISRSDFTLLYRLRDAKTDYNMVQSCRGMEGFSKVPSALYLDPERDVGPATVFVSHTWNRPFVELIESLELEERRQVERAGHHNIQKHAWPGGCATRSPRYWIDIFMKDQWAIQGNDTMTELVNAITGPGRVLVIGDGWNPIPVCLTRVWCLFEILNTLQLQAVLSFAVFSGKYKQFQLREMTARQHKWLRKLDNFDLLTRPDRFDRGAAAFPVDTDSLPIDVRHADATVESDKAMIFKKIEQGVGHDYVNAAVKQAIGTARNLALAAEEAVRKQVWKEVVWQVVVASSMWWIVLVGFERANGDGQHGAVTKVQGSESGGPHGTIFVKLLVGGLFLAPYTLGTLKTAHALVQAKRKAARGTAQPVALPALRESTRSSFSEVGGSHNTSEACELHNNVADATPTGLSRPASPSRPSNDAHDDDDGGGVAVERTPSGREALSKPNQPAIFHT
jgi:hypothetical protein